MKDKTRKLIEQSGGELYTGFGGSPDTARFTEDQLEKFAAIIAQEHESQLDEAREALEVLMRCSVCESCIERAEKVLGEESE